MTAPVTETVCVNRPLPDTITNTGRTYSFARVRGFCCSYVLEIVQLEHLRELSREVYGVEELSEPGSPQREFAVCKASAEASDDLAGLYFVSMPCPKAYAVRSAPRRPFVICWCRGFGRWQSCKHFACLADLVRSGEL